MNSLKQEIIETGKWIMAKNLTWGTSGNISASDGEHVYITASGTVMGNLREEDIILCDIEGRILEGDKKPSKETQMHLEVYRKCPEVRAVVHTSPFYSTFCACMKLPVKTNLFIESMYYGENMQRIPYFHAGSRELAEAESEAVKTPCYLIPDYETDADGDRIAAQFGALPFLAGGETSGAVTQALGYQSFRIGESVAPGVPVMTPLENPSLRLVLKSGNFGKEDFFTRAMEMTKKA